MTLRRHAITSPRRPGLVLAAAVLALSATGCGSATPVARSTQVVSATIAPTGAVAPPGSPAERSPAARSTSSPGAPATPISSASPSHNATALPSPAGPMPSTSLEPPSASAGIDTASAIAAGGVHTCILTRAGGVKCWGINSFGQLGNGVTAASLTPVDVVGLTSGVTQVAAGGYSTCALMSSGAVKCWGDNTYGQLGTGSTVGSLTPVDVKGLPVGVKAVAVGPYSACALTARGGVKCWGLNKFGYLGNGSTTDSRTPVDVRGLTSGVTAIAVGTSYSCALTTRMGLECWGFLINPNDILANPIHDTPVTLAEPASGITAIAVSGNICALTRGGGVRCGGDNTYGQLGDGSTTRRTTFVDVVRLRSGVTAVAAGANYACAVTSGGGVKCWGDNFAGQLGNGSTTKSSTPGDVVGLASGVAAIALSDGHACAIMATGAVKCWGDHGLLGNGTHDGSTTPVDVTLGGSGL
jgi:alpha-tubulin suppressor-like RCC1 family protein